MGNVSNFSNYKNVVNHELCQECPKNGITCLENDDVCLPLEMFVQISKETSVLTKLEYLDNVYTKLDLENSFKSNT